MGKGKKKKAKRKESAVNYLNSSRIVRWGLLAAVMGIFTIILYPNLFVRRHYYNLGDVAERDIKAPNDFLVEDKKATEEKRAEAADKVLTVYDLDEELPAKLGVHVNEAFEMMRKVINEEKKRIAESAPEEMNSSAAEKQIRDRVAQMKPEFEKAIGIKISNGAFKLLEKEGFSKGISDLIVRVIVGVLKDGVVSNKEVLLRETEKGITLRTLGDKKEKGVINLRQFHGADQAKTMVRVIAQPLVKDLNYNLVNLIVDFCQRIIQPNITLNKSETNERKDKAIAEVKPVFYKIKAGEMILREGERASQLQLLKLSAMNTQKKQEKIYAKSIGALLLILCMLIISYFLVTNRRNGLAIKNNKDLLFVSIILVAFFYLPNICSILFESMMNVTTYSVSASSMKFGIPIASAAMTICLFMGLDVALAFAVVIAACAAVIFQNKLDVFIYFLLNSSMAAYWMQDCRERKVFIKSGLKLGLINVALASAVSMHTDFSAVRLLWNWAFAFLGGVGAGIMTAGLVPLLEYTFGYTTDIRLLEIANLDRPILRRLMLEAPGTYHHSVIVGSMVEAAASEIGANPLLAKVCGYYHDIGKINKPLYFVENQANGNNRHDKLAPSMSGLILISHVKHGVEIAKEHKLGPDIIDTIRQHHGTTLIKYFYEKARQIRGDDAVKIQDFCYPGPKPQTREAGLVMLADVVEAASRTLENPTPSRIQGNVQRLINSIFTDGQLDNCELTLKDLHNIAKSFNKILNGIHHHRIEYPESSPAVRNGRNGKEKNGRSDKQQAKSTRDPYGVADENEGNLRRLGIS